MMKTLEWNSNTYLIGGKPEFLVSGEFHYFRVPQQDWERRLRLFREAGGNCVATYIPWILHEPVEGDIRFGDKPERDLDGFLTLCRDMGIFVIGRPGPYQYSEMKYCGLPGWLCRDYPEVLARNVRGEVMVLDSVSYLHPVFLDKTKKWFDAVCPILARHTINRGGAVAFVQFDNELTGIHEWFGGWDYNPETMGFGREDGRYASFLRRKYGGIRTLNAAYETAYAGFMDVRPHPGGSLAGVGDRRRTKDYQDFYFSTVAEYASLLAGWIRQSGIDCDLIHNSANSGSNTFHTEMVSALGEHFILGSDLYYNLDMDWNANNPTPKYAVGAFVCHETLRHMGFPSTIYELPAGSASDWPPITPEDLQACYMTNIALGMKGLNYYVFAGGYNPDKIGGDGDVYDYQAPIGPAGDIRPHYGALKEFGQFLRQHAWLADADKAGDYYLGLDREYMRSKYYSAGDPGFGQADAWEFMIKGYLMTSLCASYSPELVDVYNDSLTGKTDKPLIVVSSESMDASVQRRLVGYVQNGGRLLLSPVIPHLDEDFNACTILKDFLGNPQVERFTDIEREVRVGPVDNVFVNKGLWVNRRPPAGAVAIAEEIHSGSTAGWKKEYPGGGKVIWSGVQWRFGKTGHLRMLEFLLGQLDCGQPAVHGDNPNLWTAVRTDGSKRMLFVMNLFSAPMKGDFRVKMKDGTYRDLGTHSLNPMEVKTVLIDE